MRDCKPIAAAWAFALAAVAVRCDEGPSGPPPDTSSPMITIAFPSASEGYDRDGDGLVDLEVTFADSGRGIDPATIRVTSDRALKGGPGAEADVLSAWRIERRDGERLVVEETLAHVLPRGTVRLTVTVSDGAGNASSSSRTLDLPPLARHDVIDLRAEVFLVTSAITIGPDRRFAYVTVEERSGSALAVVDLDALRWVSTERVPVRGLSQTALDPGRRRLYVMSIDNPELLVFDLQTRRFIGSVPTFSRGIGVVYDAARDLVYMGLEVVNRAVIGVIDPGSLREIATMDLGIGSPKNPTLGLTMRLVLDPGGDRLYAGTSNSAGQGILEVALEDFRILRQFDLAPDFPDEFSGTNDLELDGDRLLAPTRHDGSFWITAVPLDGGPVRFLVDSSNAIIDMEVSPDRTEWVLATLSIKGANFLRAEVRLMDAIGERLLSVVDFPGGELDGVAFHPNGNALLVAGTVDSHDPEPSPSHLVVLVYR